MNDTKWVQGSNPVIPMDFPDPDIIRVDHTYYMVSTTMYFMPGCVILRSFDLIHWEYCSRVYDELDHTPAQCLADGQNVYGKGMWAASLRYHHGTFYVCFVAYDTKKTYLYRAKEPEGPWTKSTIDGFYHDSSLFIDDDGRTYIIYGGTQIHLTELNEELTAPKKNGIDRIIADSGKSDYLGYEGSHFYKINGKYYLFVIHSRKDKWKRVETCLSCDTLTGDFTGGIIWDDDMSFFGQGVAQGGVVETPDGRWYCFLFQDRGACGRTPVLLPMEWKNGMPFIDPERDTLTVNNVSLCPDHEYRPLYGSDDFTGRELKPFWEWNHTPDKKNCSYGNGEYRIVNSVCCDSLTQAVNTLTQRSVYPSCAAEVVLDGTGMHNGDIAGMCVLQDCWGSIGLEKRQDAYHVVVKTRRQGGVPEGDVSEDIPSPSARVRLRIQLDFSEMRDIATFFLWDGGSWKQLGAEHKMHFLLTHFTGNRFGLFSYATEEIGGSASFSDFVYDA